MEHDNCKSDHAFVILQALYSKLRHRSNNACDSGLSTSSTLQDVAALTNAGKQPTADSIQSQFMSVSCLAVRYYSCVSAQNPGIGAGAHGADVDREPKIKMMERVTRNFLQGRTARITLILQATRPVSIRWFYQDPHVGKRLDGSEVPGYMPLQGKQVFG